jgi:hypothetical protein
VATLAVFNDLDRDIILEIEGRTWDIEAYDSKVIEIEPGTYNYKLIFKDTGAVGSQGTKTWTVMTHKWHINTSGKK